MEQWLSTEFWQTVINDAAAWIITAVPSILVILILAFIGLKVSSILLSRVKTMMIKRMKSNKQLDTDEMAKRIDTLLGILTSVIKVVIWIMVGMILLRKLGIDIAPLIAGAGIAGLAVGFGAQELVRDFIAGFFMLMENQIRMGDVAIVNGTGGLVEHVGLRTIVLRDLSGVVHIFQNGKINTLSNMTKEWSAMVFDIGVAYKEDTDNVVDVIKTVAEQMRSDAEYADKIIEPIEVFGVDSFSDSAVVIKVRMKTKPIQQWSVGREYRRRLKKAFDAAGIEIPFPHRTVFLNTSIQPLNVQSSVMQES